ncbi:hypothetical protein A9Q73_01835 [Bermanella sp. 47_1433_sub80_T6]|nr:hypothetical protein A9Q73_01835 [Bermanella sp. 47_1433_sub80_T6]
MHGAIAERLPKASGRGCPRTIEPWMAFMRVMQGAIAQATPWPIQPASNTVDSPGTECNV